MGSHNVSDKIIQLPGTEALPENPVQAEDRDRYSHCGHARITLDEHQRTVNCRDCGRVLDPFGFLQHNARTLQRAWQNYEIVNRKVSELNERIAALSKEHKSLQGKVSRLREKVPTVDVRGKDKL